MTGRLISISLLGSILLTGCTMPATRTTTKSEPEIVKVDLEAAALGFPKRFISNEKDDIDWSHANHERVANMDVQVFDTGRTVDVCGGIGCDQ